MMLICLLDHIVSDGKSALILSFCSSLCFLCEFYSLPLVYDMTQYGFLHVSSPWGSFRFCNLHFIAFFNLATF